MNYEDKINLYFELLSVNPLSSNAQALVSNLIYWNKKCNWIKSFSVANLSLQAITGLSRQALDRARNEAKQKKYIDYIKGTGNHAGKYLLVYFDTQSDTQTMSQSDTQSGHKVCTLMIDKIDRQINNNIYNKQPENFVQEITDKYNSIFLQKEIFCENIEYLPDNMKKQIIIYQAVIKNLVDLNQTSILEKIDIIILEKIYGKVINTENISDIVSYFKTALINEITKK